jgi:hypothetical protein
VHLLELFKKFVVYVFFLIKTQPNFMKRKHPTKGEKKKQGARTKAQARMAYLHTTNAGFKKWI